MRVIDKRQKNIEKLRNLNLKAYYNKDNIDTQNLMNLGLNMYVKNYNFKHELYNIFNESQFDSKKILHPQQVEILNLLFEGNNVLLSAPTSFGKTFIALEFISRNKFKNIIFVVPTLALMNELSKKISDKFSSEYNIISNSFENILDKNIFIIVPERIDLNLLNNLNDIDIDFLVFDEIYKLKRIQKSNGNDKRIISLNKGYFDMVNKAKQILLLGPFIKDLIFSRTKLTNEITKYFSDFAPVYIETYYINDSKNKFVISELKRKNSKLIYFKSPGSILKFCNSQKINLTKSISNSLTNWCDKYISEQWLPSLMLKKGIGIHYGSIPTFMRKYIEYLYNNEMIINMFCTSTLLEGINTPTNELIIYDSEKLSSFQVNNLIGRVGRLDMFQKGKIFYFDKSLEEKILGEEKYETIEIVAEDDKIQYLEELLYLEKEADKITKEQKKILEQLSSYLRKYNLELNDLKNTDNFVVDEFLEFLRKVPELLKLLSVLNFDINSDDSKLKIKATNDRQNIIKLFMSIIKNNSYQVQQINEGKKLINLSVCVNKLLAKTPNNIYLKIKKEIDGNYERIGIKKINLFIDLLFDLSFKYIKYDLSKIVKYCNFIFTDEYVNTLSEKDKNLIKLLKEEILIRFEMFNSDNNKVIKILLDLGIPYYDANLIYKKYKINENDEYISTGKIYNYLKENKEEIKRMSNIDEVTVDLLDMII